MKNLKLFSCSLLLLLCFAFQPLLAQNQREGFSVKEVKQKTTIYEIKIVGLGGPISSQQLDEMLLSREGIIAAHTDFNTKVCTLEATKEYDRKLIVYLLGLQGLRIAKTFN